MKHAYFLFLLAILSAESSLFAQRADSTVFIAVNKQRIQSQKQAMYVLGAWSAGNIAWGAYGLSTVKSGSERYFHEMNLMWNSINISIATFGLISTIKEKPVSDGLETIKRFHQTEQAFLFNSGLDLAYVMSGLYLREFGRNRNQDRMIGFGNSIMLQGGFLFVFDLVKYLGLRNKTKGVYKLLERTSFDGRRVMLNMSF